MLAIKFGTFHVLGRGSKIAVHSHHSSLLPNEIYLLQGQDFFLFNGGKETLSIER